MTAIRTARFNINYSAIFPHSTLTCLVPFLQWTVTMFLYRINQTAFLIVARCSLCGKKGTCICPYSFSWFFKNIKLLLVVNTSVFESIKFLHTYRNATVGGFEKFLFLCLLWRQYSNFLTPYLLQIKCDVTSTSTNKTQSFGLISGNNTGTSVATSSIL